MCMWLAAIGTIYLPDPYVVDDFFTRCYFAFARIAQRADIHDEFIESFEWHFRITDEFGKGFGFNDVVAVVFLNFHEAMHHGFRKAGFA